MDLEFANLENSEYILTAFYEALGLPLVFYVFVFYDYLDIDYFLGVPLVIELNFGLFAC